MKTFVYTVTEETGIHARPAAQLAKEARKYASELTISANGGSADLKKLVAMLRLCIKKGDEVTVTVRGETEDADHTVLKAYFEENL